MTDSKPLDGRVALVTGASRGIGAATAEALAAAGAHVVLVARTAKALEEVEERIHEAGGSATIAPLDLSQGDSIAKLGSAIAERWNKLDVLVLNAAMLGSLTPVQDIDPKEYSRILTLNVLANQALIAAFDPLLRASADAIEAEGVRRALGRARDAHLMLLLLDASAKDPRAGLPPDLAEPDLTVWNKYDLAPHDGISISLKTGEGLPGLVELLRQKVQQKLEGGGAPLLTRARHRAALEEAAHALRHGLEAPEDRPELLAEDLRLAMRAVGRVTGRVDVEELLDFVFRDFCIGK